MRRASRRRPETSDDTTTNNDEELMWQILDEYIATKLPQPQITAACSHELVSADESLVCQLCGYVPPNQLL